MTTASENLGTYTTLAVTALNSVASSPTVGWQSARVDNMTTVKALDYEVFIQLTMANTAPANDKAAYVYAVPWMYDGSTWYPATGGTTTSPSGSDAAYTIATPNNLTQVRTLNYTTQNMVLRDIFNLSNAFGAFMPDGWSLVVIDYTGAAISGSGNIVAYKALKVDSA